MRLGRWAGALLAAAALSSASCRQRDEPLARNLLVVVIDTLRQDHVGVYGGPLGLTPTMDRLARQGAAADGIAPSSWTKPSIATLLTGLHPLRHQVVGKTDLFPETVGLLAERLRARGFRTAAISANAHVAPAWGFDRGIDQFVAYWKETGERFPSSARINERVEGLLDGLESPYFLYVHYLDPHQPYAPSTLPGGAPLPERLARLVPLRLPAGIPRPGAVSPDQVAAARELYDAEVAESDAALGALLDLLGARGLARDLLTVVVSDHGEEFLEHGRLGHGFDLYGETVRVPLILHAPGVVTAGLRIGEMGLEDVAPTVLDLLAGKGARELAAAGEVDGRSYVSALRGTGPAPPPRPQLLHLDSTESPALAFVDGGWKLVLGESPYAKELYHLTVDPDERLDRIGDPPPSFAMLATSLAARFDRLAAVAPTRRRGSADAELLANLVALGYLDPLRSGNDRRLFPRRLRPADAFVAGLRGWEDVGSFAPCFAAATAPRGQLLAGWSGGGTEEGVWALAEASFALPPLDGAATTPLAVELSGHQWAPGRLLIDFSMEGAPTTRVPVEPGPFRITLPLAQGGGKGPRIVRFRAESPFRPREAGSEDPRDLSLLVRRICVVAQQPADPR